FMAPMNVRVGAGELPIGAIAVGILVGVLAFWMLFSGDIPSIASVSLIAGLGIVTLQNREQAESSVAVEEEPFQLSTSPDLSVGQMDVPPGNVLVAVRHVHSLSHVSSALHAAGNRDVVVLTVRLQGVDVDNDAGSATSTRDERQL